MEQTTTPRRDTSQILTEAIKELSMATGVGEVTELVLEAAREIAKADGSAFILKDEERWIPNEIEGQFRSLFLVPVRPENPFGILQVFWTTDTQISVHQMRLLKILAQSFATALENLELRRKVQKPVDVETALQMVAHDLRHPLAKMVLCADLLKERLEKDPENSHVDELESIVQTGQQAGKKIGQMLAVYRVDRRAHKGQKAI